MIGFWIAAALLTAAAVALLVRPLLRRAESADFEAGEAEGRDLAVYRDQLAELERDRARGLVDPSEASALEAEIGRRMLGAARQRTITGDVGRPSRALLIALAALVPVGALGVYLAVGHPELPAQPLASRQVSPDSDPAKILAQVEQLRAKLKPIPEDLDRWIMLGEAYSKLGKPRDAVEMFRVASGLAPQDSSLRAALAENLIMANGGAIGAEAKTIFAAIPNDAPARPEARFYLALADFQAGDLKGALKGWQELLADSPADAPWIEQTRGRIAEVAKSLGLDPARETPTPKPPAPRPAGVPDPSAIAQMTPEQQQEMIRSMVATLAAKLEANPDNPTGWRQLARAYTVLGEEAKAKAALDRAAQAEAKAAAKQP